jgi:hypothetical protein
MRDLYEGTLDVLPFECRRLFVRDAVVAVKPIFNLFYRDLSLSLLVCLVSEDKEWEVLGVLWVCLDKKILTP